MKTKILFTFPRTGSTLLYRYYKMLYPEKISLTEAFNKDHCLFIKNNKIGVTRTFPDQHTDAKMKILYEYNNPDNLLMKVQYTHVMHDKTIIEYLKQNYSFVSTVRNPYHMVLSYYIAEYNNKWMLDENDNKDEILKNLYNNEIIIPEEFVTTIMTWYQEYLELIYSYSSEIINYEKLYKIIPEHMRQTIRQLEIGTDLTSNDSKEKIVKNHEDICKTITSIMKNKIIFEKLLTN